MTMNKDNAVGFKLKEYSVFTNDIDLDEDAPNKGDGKGNDAREFQILEAAAGTVLVIQNQFGTMTLSADLLMYGPPKLISFNKIMKETTCGRVLVTW